MWTTLGQFRNGGHRLVWRCWLGHWGHLLILGKRQGSPGAGGSPGVNHCSLLVHPKSVYVSDTLPQISIHVPMCPVGETQRGAEPAVGQKGSFSASALLSLPEGALSILPEAKRPLPVLNEGGSLTEI